MVKGSAAGRGVNLGALGVSCRQPQSERRGQEKAAILPLPLSSWRYSGTGFSSDGTFSLPEVTLGQSHRLSDHQTDVAQATNG